MTIRCITFDLDDTLWDTGSVIARAERCFYEWLDENCPNITERYDAAALVRHRHAFFAGFPDQRHDLTGMRKRWLAHLFESHDVQHVAADTAFQVFWEHRNAVTLYAGVETMLERLAKRLQVGVITNGNACVHFIGIGHHFDFVVSSERAGVAKPAREIFELALADAGIDASESVHVGDDPSNDVLGAAAVGMRTVWYNPNAKPWPGGRAPDATITALDQLDAAIVAIGDQSGQRA